MAFEKIKFAMKTWKDAVSGGTPISAAELNRIEKGISDTAKGVNDLGDSVSQLLVSKDVRELDGNDFNAIGTCFQAIYQRSGWKAGQHGPIGTSSYGFLFSAQGGNSDIQIFVDNAGNIAFRVRFSGNVDWPNWAVIGASK